MARRSGFASLPFQGGFAWALCFAFPPDCGHNRHDVGGVPSTPGAISAPPSAELPSHDHVDAASGAPPSALSQSSASALSGAPALPALQADWLIELPVEGFHAARVSVPQGATEPRPVVVALHGWGDRPEWSCGGWRGATDAYPFVICPSGQPGGLPGGFVWGADAAVEREVNASVEALRRRFGDYVAPGCTLLAGFSQGAIRMAPMLARGGGWCPQAALCEGAYDALGKNFARAFVGSGGRRLLLGCSQPYCAKTFGERETPLRSAGVEVRTVYSGGRTHNLNGEMVSTLRDAWPWLVRDDARWSSYGRARSQEKKSVPTN